MRKLWRGWIIFGVFIPVMGFSQTISLGLGGGFLAVLGHSFYTDPVGTPGVYVANGVASEFLGLGLRNEFQIAGILDLRLPNLPAAITISVDYTFFRGHGNTLVYENLPTAQTIWNYHYYSSSGDHKI